MPYRALVADDDPEICTLVRTVLRAAFETTVCHDAESALTKLRADVRFDVLVSDFMLPGMSGLDLVRAVRRDRARTALPIVMISAHNNYANYGMEQRALEAGADAFLNKPFSITQFRQTVTGLVSAIGRAAPSAAAR